MNKKLLLGRGKIYVIPYLYIAIERIIFWYDLTGDPETTH